MSANQDVRVTMSATMDISNVLANVNALQNSFNKLKLPEKLGNNLSKNIADFQKEYDKYQKKISEGIKTQGDYNAVEKSLNKMRTLYQAIGNDAMKLTKLDMKSMLNVDSGEFKKITAEIAKVTGQFNNIKFDSSALLKPIEQIRNLTKSSKVSGDNGILNQMLGNIKTGQIAEAKKQLQDLKNYAEKVAPRETVEGKRMPGTLSAEKYTQLSSAINIIGAAFAKADSDAAPFIAELDRLQKELEETKSTASGDILSDIGKFNDASKNVDKVTDSLKRMHQEEFGFSREAQNLDRQIQSYFGLSQMIRKVGNIARDAFSTVKELDKAMTETAVVTHFDVGDMWNMLPTYTEQANQLGSTIKDVYEAATLYYQQGLNTNQAMGLANETLKMARIAGMGAAEATDMMTAALRGFNMEINQASAQKINDVYSELAAITASNTQEIGSAMERTASIAHSANMDFATTSAFLAQMIETTREAPENLGTAMKTIVARFQEMKQDPTKLIDSEGVAMDANKVDKALKSVGISLMNTKGEFRNLDEVFLEISSKWDSLTQGQQRYIATMAAGSRQQSRFLAMMSNYERTMELVDAANNSAGASQRQFEKTLESMDTKLNKLKNAWDQFTMGLMNNQILKFGVDALTQAFTIVNKLINLLGGKIPDPFGGIVKSIMTLGTTLVGLNLGKKLTRGLITGGVGWWKNETSLIGGFQQGWSSGNKTGIFRDGKSTANAEQQGTVDGQAYGRGWARAVQAIQTKQETGKGFLNQFTDTIKNNKAGLGSNADVLKALYPQSELNAEAQEIANNFLNMLRSELSKGTITSDQLPELFESKFSLTQGLSENFDANNLEEAVRTFEGKKLKSIGTGFTGLTSNINSAGVALSNFGMILRGTPLEGFGAIITTVGTSLISLSTAIATTKASFLEQWAAATLAAAGEETAAVAALQAAVANGTLTVSTITAAGGFATLGVAIGLALIPLLAIAAIIGIAVGAYKLLDAAIVTNKEQLESTQNAAAAAADAYSSIKQETSELSDSIEQIQSNEDAFEGLVVGTAEFNEQLATANEQIMDLVKKYPMLNDPEYLSTDKNGLMHINEAGLKAVKDYQSQRQANASALNMIQNADLAMEESRQKAEQMRKVKGTDTLDSLNQRTREAELLEQQAKAQKQVADATAVNTALVDKEIHNREKVSAILADQLEMRRESVDLQGVSKHDLRQEYADFYGYKYDKSTKKITDIEGNEVDVDDKVIKDAVKDIRAIVNIEADAKSLDGMIGAINSKFSKALGDTFENSGNLLSDILTNNLDTDDNLLQQLVANPDKIKEAVHNLSEKEIAALVGASTEAVAQMPDKYEGELVNKLTEKATNIAETQAKSYADLASMLAQANFKTSDALISQYGKKANQEQKKNQNFIKKQLKNLTVEQRNTLANIGKSLRDTAGIDSMKTFVGAATDIYTSKNQANIQALDNALEGINWDSAVSAVDKLEAYNKMTKSTSPAVSKLGKDLLNSADSANLLGEAFAEVYNSSDFQELAENMDSFADSTGKFNATSVMEMAKESGSLNKLLETGAISAGGFAAALNAMGSVGGLTMMDLNSNVLELLSTIYQLDDAIASAHSSIENFDWGVDTGEAEDFVKDSAEKWNELYKNEEFGNPQLEAYAKFVLGEENYIKLLNKNHGDLEATMNEVSKTVNRYADGFDNAWADLASGSWKDKVDDLPDDLKSKGISMSYDENGNIIWEPGVATTNDLISWLEKVEGVSEDMAKIMLEDWENYSPDFKQERIKNDFQQGLINGHYIDERKLDNGELLTTASDIKTIAAATGQDEAEVKAQMASAAKISEEQLHVLDNMGENGMPLQVGDKGFAELAAQYNQLKTGSQDKSWIQEYQNKEGTGVELKNAITGAVTDGLTQDQATEMARAEALKSIEEGGRAFYDGVELQKDELSDLGTFSDRIAEITEGEQWRSVGQAIAEGFISWLNGKETPEETKDDYYNRSAKESGETSSATRASDFSLGTPTEDPKVAAGEKSREMWNGVWQAVKNSISGTPTEDPKTAAGEQSRQQWSNTWQAVKQAFTSGTVAEDPKIAAGEQSRQQWSGIWQAVKTAVSSNEGVEDPKTAAAEAASTTWASIWSSVKSAFTTQPQVNPDPKQNIQPEAQTQEINQVIHADTSEVDAAKAKLDEIRNAASSPATITVNANVGNATTQALTSINQIKNATKGNNTIKVSAKVSGKEDVSNLSTVITQVKPKTVNVNANVSGISSVNSLKNSIDSLSSKTVTITTVKETINRTRNEPGAIGKRNHGYAPAPPKAGSAARGNYGQLGPKGKGGLTLTGELGYEIAWLPDQNQSMILGANGPQMLNLPGNAVIWDHEQSKKIMSQKAIPAGSHSRRSSKHSTGGSSGGSGGSGGSGKSGGSGRSKGSGKGNNNNNNNKIKQETGYVSVFWENMTRRVDAVQRKVDKAASAFEKKLKSVGTTLASMTSLTKNYKKSLQEQINTNKVAEKEARRQLSILDTGKDPNTKKKNAFYSTAEISYELKKKKDGKESKETKKEKVNLAGYIKYNKKTGAYEIDQAKIKTVAAKNKSKAEAIKQAAEKELNDRLTKIRNAEDQIKKAQEALAKLNDDIYDAFYSWEKSLNQVYYISKKIELISSRISIQTGKTDALFAQLEAGAATAAQAQTQINNALKQQMNLMTSKVTASYEKIADAQVELNKKLNLKTYFDIYNANPDSEKAKGDYEAAKKALEIVDKLRASGNYDYASAITALNGQNYNEETYNKVKDILEKIFEAQEEVLSATEEAFGAAQEMYEQLQEMQSYIADFESDLLKGLEEQAEAELDRLDKFNSGLEKALKNLLDEVKKKLDERRRKEDNAKTESDLSKKQQRLALLRADTSGNNAAEIAQLEKEIAEGQQSYQRTLEDQLLDRLQQQGDEAQKQRERQIELLRTQNDITNKNGANIELVTKWLTNPKQYREEIKQAWLAQQGYDELGPKQQQELGQQFEAEFGKLIGYTDQLKNQQTIINQINQILNKLNNKDTNVTLDAKRSFAEFKAAGGTVAQAKKAGFSVASVLKGGYTAAQLKKAGYTAKDLKSNKISAKDAKKQGWTAKDLKAGGYSATELKNAGFTAKQIKDAGYTAAQFKSAKFTAQEAKNAGYSGKDIASAYGASTALKMDYSGTTVQAGTNASVETLQRIINEKPNDKATQSDLAGVKDTIDINGSKKGGAISGTVSSGGTWVYANSGSTLYAQQLNTKTGKPTGKISKISIGSLATSHFKANKKEATEALVYAIQHQQWGSKINKNFKGLVAAAGIGGKQYKLGAKNHNWYASLGTDGLIYQNVSNGVGKWNPATGKTSVDKYNKANFLKIAKRNNGASREYAQVLIDKKAYTKAQLQKLGVKQFETGGLADFTGPAWLDGTSSKPELVLNAQDTKNFLALKDVLSRVMNSTGSIENTYGGDAVYDIDINVDHINNDYDVDKIADRIEKKIVQKSSYRNVTQVRKFR